MFKLIEYLSRKEWVQKLTALRTSLEKLKAITTFPKLIADGNKVQEGFKGLVHRKVAK